MKQNDKALTYQELIALAKQHYNEGGDTVYECWDEHWFNLYVSQFGPITKKSALAMFRIDNVYRNEVMSSWR